MMTMHSEHQSQTIRMWLVAAVVAGIVAIPLDLFYGAKFMDAYLSPTPGLEAFDGLKAVVYFMFLVVAFIPTVIFALALGRLIDELKKK